MARRARITPMLSRIGLYHDLWMHLLFFITHQIQW